MRITRSLTCLLPALIAGFGSPAGGQAPPSSNYELRLSEASGPPGGVVSIVATLDSAVDPVRALSLGICHDPAELTVENAVVGADLNIANGGQPPGLLAIQNVDGGVILAFIVDTSFGGTNTLPLGTQELLVVDYRLTGPATTLTTPLEFCNTLLSLGGSTDPVQVTVSTINGDEFTPDQVSGSITYAGPPAPVFTFTAPSRSVGFLAGIGEASFVVRPTIGEVPPVPGQPTDTFGFAMAVRHDPKFLAVTDAEAEPILESLNGGGGAEFFSTVLMPDGVTLAAIYSFDGTETLHFEAPQPVARLTYETNAATLEEVTRPVTTVLDWTNDLGSPPVANLVGVSVDGDVLTPVRVDGVVTLVPGSAVFVRGECSGNGHYDISDPLRLLGLLFMSSGPVSCDDACDADDDGELNVADSLYMLENLFLLGPNPPGPYPVCGLDPSSDFLRCDSYTACP